MRWILALAVLLGLIGRVAADEPRTDGKAKALEAARELAHTAGTAAFPDALRRHVDVAAFFEQACGHDHADLEPGEREEAETLLRAYLGAQLGHGLARASGAGEASFDAQVGEDGRVSVVVGGADAGERLVFAPREGGLRVVDLGPEGKSTVAMLRARYARSKEEGPLDPLAFAWSVAWGQATETLLPKPLWRAPLPAPNPAWSSRETLQDGIAVPLLGGLPIDDARGEDAWIVISLSREGKVGVRPQGRYGPLEHFDLSPEDPGVQDDAIQAFTAALASATRGPEHRSPDGMSTRRALIRADGGAKWKYVQWVVQACAHPTVRVFRVSFALGRIEAPAGTRRARAAAESPFGRIDHELPTDASLQTTAAATLRIKMFRREMDSPERAYTIIKVDLDKTIFALPVAWKGRAHETPARIRQYDHAVAAVQRAVEARLAAQGAVPAGARGELVAPPPKGGHVPHEDVMAMVHLLRSLGIHDLAFEGAAAPLTSAERAARNARK